MSSMTTAEIPMTATTTSQKEFPNLYEELLGATISSILVFVAVDMRDLVRSQLLDAPQILDLPVMFDTVRDVLHANKELIEKNIKTEEFKALAYLRKVKDQFESASGSRIHVISDENASSECVYAISANSITKRIVVTFRGSITLQDWIQDIKVVFAEIQNPLHGTGVHTDQPETIPVHYGFREYLFDTKSGRTGGDGVPFFRADSSMGLNGSLPQPEESIPKIRIILDQIRALKVQHPDFRIYTCGHSLGGAIALLLALEAAFEFGSLQDPVTCITVGNPRAGGLELRQAMSALQADGRLRCVGVHNRLDVVPLIPNEALCACSKLSGMRHRYEQLGIQVLLDHEKVEIKDLANTSTSRYQVLREILRRWLLLLPGIYRMKERHSYNSYLQLIVRHKKYLSSLRLNEIYEQQRPAKPK